MFEQRERADQPERDDVVLFRIDELLELIERKGKCRDVDSLKIGRTNNIEVMSVQNRIIAVGSYQICPGWDFGNFLCRSLARGP
jgi:pyruvate/2-oxoglutarate dehydrogenase complex dihydrolipoamide dehydrogenase (E3) component